MRPIRFAKQILNERDWTTAALALAILMTAAWILMLPFLPAVQKIALNRFHLQTGNFPGWAVQQIVPSMYNFENEFRFYPDKAMTPVAREFSKVHQVNHFPLRVVTYFDGRYILFGDGNSGEIELTTRFRSSQLITRWKVSRFPDGSLNLELLDSHD